mgnify:CR=1 FL=1
MLATEKRFETPLGIGSPWCAAGAAFDAQTRTLAIGVDGAARSRFAVPGVDGGHPVPGDAQWTVSGREAPCLRPSYRLAAFPVS